MNKFVMNFGDYSCYLSLNKKIKEIHKECEREIIVILKVECGVFKL